MMPARKGRERIRMPMSRTAGATSRTKQSFKDECDVNFIIEQFQSTGVLKHQQNKVPQYIDVTAAGDLQSSIEAVQAAKKEFYALPSGVRAAAENSPVMFLAMSADEAGMAVLMEAGLQGELQLQPAPVGSGEPEREPETAPEGGD